jgi:hypothetical protein
MKNVKSVNLVLDETRRVIGVTVDGKRVKAGSMRGLTKAQNCGYWQLEDSPQDAQNPFSGVVVNLTAFEASVYNWCLNWYARYERGIVAPPIQTYDDMKYLLLELNPDAYMDLID